MPPKTGEKTSLRAHQWTPQEDVDITENLAHPQLQAKDYALLMFCGWLAVVVGAVCGQWVADEVLGHLFLWAIFLRRDMRETKRKVSLVGGVLFGTALLY